MPLPTKAEFEAAVESATFKAYKQTKIDSVLRDADVLEKYIQGLSDELMDKVDLVDEVLKWKGTNETLDPALVQKTIRPIYPHVWVGRVDRGLAHKALVLGDVSACGELMKEYGPDAFAQLQKTYGVSKIGERGKEPPISETEAVEKASRIAALKKELASLEADTPKQTPHAKNPFSSQHWSLAGQGALVKSLGLETTASIARAVGCKIGDVRPNPAYSK
jgi:hypothetical protein